MRAGGEKSTRGGEQRKRDKRDVHGWVVLDKPVGMTSTHAVAVVKRLFSAKRAGHAGTLDPLASGLSADRARRGDQNRSVHRGQPQTLPLHRALGRGARHRRRRRPRGRNERGASAARMRSAPCCPQFTGAIEQVPPRYSAIKIEGERAYDLARDGQEVELQSRLIDVGALDLVESPDADHSVLETECGKGTYVRALARDIGRVLGCFGHVSALRRTSVGPFGEVAMISLEQLAALCDRAAAGEGNLADALLPVETALDDIPALAVSRADAARLQRGQTVLLRGRDAPLLRGTVYVTASGDLVALADVDRGEIVPKRVFNLAGLHGTSALRKGH